MFKNLSSDYPWNFGVKNISHQKFCGVFFKNCDWSFTETSVLKLLCHCFDTEILLLNFKIFLKKLMAPIVVTRTGQVNKHPFNGCVTPQPIGHSPPSTTTANRAPPRPTRATTYATPLPTGPPRLITTNPCGRVSTSRARPLPPLTADCRPH